MVGFPVEASCTGIPRRSTQGILTYDLALPDSTWHNKRTCSETPYAGNATGELATRVVTHRHCRVRPSRTEPNWLTYCSWELKYQEDLMCPRGCLESVWVHEFR